MSIHSDVVSSAHAHTHTNTSIQTQMHTHTYICLYNKNYSEILSDLLAVCALF